VQSSVRHSSGCARCKFTGCAGRAGLVELLEIRDRLREKIAHDAENEIRQAAREFGFTGITEQAVRLVAEGAISVREAYRTCYFGGE
jgi:general secretion pathway protein E